MAKSWHVFGNVCVGRIEKGWIERRKIGCKEVICLKAIAMLPMGWGEEEEEDRLKSHLRGTLKVLLII